MRDPYYQKESKMELPSTKYKIGDKLYLVNGGQCFPFTVSAITFVLLADETFQFVYKYDDPVSKKPVQAFEPQLVATWEEAKASMKQTIDQAVENAYKQLEAAVDPYKLPEENV